jgi:hypothetical protein
MLIKDIQPIGKMPDMRIFKSEKEHQDILG